MSTIVESQSSPISSVIHEEEVYMPIDLLIPKLQHEEFSEHKTQEEEPDELELDGIDSNTKSFFKHIRELKTTGRYCQEESFYTEVLKFATTTSWPEFAKTLETCIKSIPDDWRNYSKRWFYQNIKEICGRYNDKILSVYQANVVDGLKLENEDLLSFFSVDPVQHENLIDAIRGLHPMSIEIEHIIKLSSIIPKLGILQRKQWSEIVTELCNKLKCSLQEMTKAKLQHISETLSRNDFMNENLLDLYSIMRNLESNNNVSQEEKITFFEDDCTYNTYNEAYAQPIAEHFETQLNSALDGQNWVLLTDLCMYLNNESQSIFYTPQAVTYIELVFSYLVKQPNELSIVYKEKLREFIDTLVRTFDMKGPKYREVLKESLRTILNNVINMPKHNMWILKMLKSFNFVHATKEQVNMAVKSGRSDAFINLLKKMCDDTQPVPQEDEKVKTFYSIPSAPKSKNKEFTTIIDTTSVKDTTTSVKETGAKEKHIAFQLSWNEGSISIDIQRGKVDLKEINGRMCLQVNI
jgi:hypothetical protein